MRPTAMLALCFAAGLAVWPVVLAVLLAKVESETSSVRLSSLGPDYDRKPEAHTFVRSVAAWEILPEDGLPRYEIRAT